SHFHLSVKSHKARYDDPGDWSLSTLETSLQELKSDGDRETINSLLALSETIDPDQLPLPQLVAMQNALIQLFANYADHSGLAESAAEASDDADRKIPNDLLQQWAQELLLVGRGG